MRKSCDSSTDWWISSASAWADSRSCPNGFSTTTRAFFVSPASASPLTTIAEQERRDLQVEHRLLRAGIALPTRSYVAASEKSPETYDKRAASRSNTSSSSGSPVPTIDVARPLDELLDGPVVDGHADDRAVEQAAPLEPVQRPERHHLRQVAGDPEDDEDVGRLLSAGGHTTLPPEGALGCGRRLQHARPG